MADPTRRQFVQQFSGALLGFGLAPSLLAGTRFYQEEEFNWFNTHEMEVEGKGWEDTSRYFDRLPARAEGLIRDQVWNLSRHSAGMKITFKTDSPIIRVKYDLFLERLAMPHMPATGVSGIDLYAKDSMGIERWVGVNRPSETSIDAQLANGLRSGMREYYLYLPLYNGVNELEIGILEGHQFKALPKRQDKPMVFYGTSIMHGACASRPGMAFPSILGRRLEQPVINLGFSGNGRMEAEVGELISELDASLFAIDCLPNMNWETVSERAVPLVKILRNTHPDTPILLVEDRSFTNTPFFESRMQHHDNSRKALSKAFAELNAMGMKDIYYLQGDQLLGLDGEATTDGSHPSDLGMERYADAYEPILRQMLNIG